MLFFLLQDASSSVKLQAGKSKARSSSLVFEMLCRVLFFCLFHVCFFNFKNGSCLSLRICLDLCLDPLSPFRRRLTSPRRLALCSWRPRWLMSHGQRLQHARNHACRGKLLMLWLQPHHRLWAHKLKLVSLIGKHFPRWCL